MLYIDKNTINISIACNQPKGGSYYTLVLKGMTNIEYQYELTDTMQSSLYYVFELAEPIEIPTGTYNYRLISDDKLVNQGLLQYGEAEDPEAEPTTKYYQREINRLYYNKYARQQQDNDTEIISD